MVAEVPELRIIDDGTWNAAALASADAENRAVAYTAIRELTAPVNGPKSTSTAAFNPLLAKNEADTQSKGALVAGSQQPPS
jgi:hypothetical protein